MYVCTCVWVWVCAHVHECTRVPYGAHVAIEGNFEVSCPLPLHGPHANSQDGLSSLFLHLRVLTQSHFYSKGNSEVFCFW